jgi:hypothetical protein
MWNCKAIGFASGGASMIFFIDGLKVEARNLHQFNGFQRQYPAGYAQWLGRSGCG